MSSALSSVGAECKVENIATNHDEARRSSAQLTSIRVNGALPDRGRVCVELRKTVQLGGRGSLQDEVRGKKD
jgi:hypothetical protein